MSLFIQSADTFTYFNHRCMNTYLVKVKVYMFCMWIWICFECMCVSMWPQLGFVWVCISMLSVEQSREHKTDHTVTAHFPAHYQQQGLMGAYNEGPWLGQVTGEHSPNPTHPSFASFPSPSHILLIFTPPLICHCISPEVSDPVCPLVPPFCPFFTLPSTAFPPPMSHTCLLALFLAAALLNDLTCLPCFPLCTPQY